MWRYAYSAAVHRLVRFPRQTPSQEVAQIAEGRRDATRDWTSAGVRKSPNQNLSLGPGRFSLLSYNWLLFTEFQINWRSASRQCWAMSRGGRPGRR
jgi:hypothetical protein